MKFGNTAELIRQFCRIQLKVLFLPERQPLQQTAFKSSHLSRLNGRSGCSFGFRYGFGYYPTDEAWLRVRKTRDFVNGKAAEHWGTE
jgi:hypothetical protein